MSEQSFPTRTVESAIDEAAASTASCTAMLGSDDRTELLRISRIALKQWLLRGGGPIGAPHRETLLARRSAFVTLHVDGKLRGCIGRLDAELPLYQTIIDLTVSAATRDPRFPSVRTDEVGQTKIEISVLSPRAPLDDPSSIAIGTHGLVVTRGPQSGLLLPQVAVEHSWSADTFLAETCMKAGLDATAWSEPGTDVETFTAEVFGDG